MFSVKCRLFMKTEICFLRLALYLLDREWSRQALFLVFSELFISSSLDKLRDRARSGVQNLWDLLPCKKFKKDLDLQVVSRISKTMKTLQWIPNIINNGKVTVNSKYYHEPQPTYNMKENLFRLIFETKIHIHIPIRYFKSLHKASYYSTTIHMKNLYLHSKTHNMGWKWNLYLKSLSRRGPINLSTQTFRNINLTETMTNLIVA